MGISFKIVDLVTLLSLPDKMSGIRHWISLDITSAVKVVQLYKTFKVQ